MPASQAVLLATSLLLLASCASTGGPRGEPRAAPSGGPGAGHPLEGRIYDVRHGVFISFAELVEALAGERLVVLGERHDNAAHHRNQARILAGLVEAGRRPAVALEMITVDEQQALDDFLARPDANAAELGPAVRWEERGWPAWSMYRPIAEVALGSGLKIVAANLSRAQLMMIVHHRGASGPDVPGVVPLRPLSPEKQERLAAIIRESHCGHAPEGMVRAMVGAQRARDAFMAERAAAAGEQVVLMAGDQHARRDFGVPFYWSEPGSPRGASVAMVEVHDGITEPAEYVVAPDGEPLYDFAWFTERSGDGEDPCVRFKEQLEGMGKQ